MNQDEYQEWRRYHAKAYPGLIAWLDRNDGQDVLWQRLLANTPYEAAKAATDQMFSMDEQPRGYSEHPRIIRRLAYEVAPRRDTRMPTYIDGQATFACGRCQDSGFVSVLTPETLKRVWRDDANKALRYCTIACDCDEGNRVIERKWDKRHRMPQWRSGHALIRLDAKLKAKKDEPR